MWPWPRAGAGGRLPTGPNLRTLLGLAPVAATGSSTHSGSLFRLITSGQWTCCRQGQSYLHLVPSSLLRGRAGGLVIFVVDATVA